MIVFTLIRKLFSKIFPYLMASLITLLPSSSALSNWYSTGATLEAHTAPEDMTMTVMVYCIGSDLESNGGCATADLQEILAAGLSDRVNVVIQTGGTENWQNNVMKDGEVERFHLVPGQDGSAALERVMPLGIVSMCQPQTLSNFISWTAKNYPADRYMMLMWDHGGGTLRGFGRDEVFQKDNLMISELAQAFRDGGVHFSLLTFDACLMSTLEIAYALHPYCDYMLASEEMSSGYGLYHTGWLETLNQDPSVDVKEVANQAIVDFMDLHEQNSIPDKTLALLDLSKAEPLYDCLGDYLAQFKDVEASEYHKLAYMRGRTKVYGYGVSEQIDLGDFVECASEYLGIEDHQGVLQTLDEMIISSGTNIRHSSGLAFYFPYRALQAYDATTKEMESLGMKDQEYRSFFDDFATLTAAAQKKRYLEQSTSSELTAYALYGLFGMKPFEDFSDEAWYEPKLAQTEIKELPVVNVKYGKDQSGEYLLKLEQEDLELLSSIELVVQTQLGDKMVYLGEDNRYALSDRAEDNSRALSLVYDQTWLHLNQDLVSFHYIDSGAVSKDENNAKEYHYSYGYVPAMLNEERPINIVVYWDDDQCKAGTVFGYYLYLGEDEAGDRLAYRQSILDFKEGDQISYAYENIDNGEKSWIYANPVTYTGSLTPSYESRLDLSGAYAYQLTDIYQNHYLTDWIDFGN